MLFFIKNFFIAIKNLLKYVGFISFIQVQMMYPVYATVNIAIINKAGSNTNKLNSANGIPIINIDKVNSKGQSFNDYDFFDVGKEGLIFNNSSGLSQTELAGWISGNTNLNSSQSANLIVNTVRSKRSELRGYMEVAGNKADVIILNSNGILCDGCGFINTNRGILSTGEALFNNGSFIGIGVLGGEIEIGRGGLNAEKANRIDILSQQLKLNGQIRGNEINVSLGGQNYNYNTGTSLSNGINGSENYVISSSEFGGMYGDSIRLISHNNSLGVNIDFNMATSGSKLEVDTAGNLVISGKLSSKGDMDIRGADVYITNNSELNSLSSLKLLGNSLNFAGKLNSSVKLDLNFNRLYTLQGSTIQSVGDINILANNYGKFEGSILGASNILVQGDELNFLSDLTSQKGLRVSGNKVNVGSNANLVSAEDMMFVANSLDIFGKILSAKKLDLNSKDISLQNGSIVQGLNVSIDATNLDLQSGSSITSMENFIVNLQGNFNLHQGVQLGANKDFYLKAYNINLYAGADLSANGKMNLVANNLYLGIGNDVSNSNNKTTTISSKGDLSLNISSEANIQAQSNLTTKGLLTFRSSLINNRGFIAGQDIVFNVDYLNNWGRERIGTSHNSYDNMGVIYAVGGLSIEGLNGGNSKYIRNSSSKIQTLNSDININADTFENTLSWWHIYENIGAWNTVYNYKDYKKSWGPVYDFIDREVINTGHDIRDVYYTYQNIFERDVTYDIFGSSGATLSSGGNINIKGGQFINRSSSITALGNTKLEVVDFKNETVAKNNYKETKFEFYKQKTTETNYKDNWNYKWDGGTSFLNDSYETTNKNLVTFGSARISSGGDLSISASNSFNNGFSAGYQNVGTGGSINYESGTNLKEQEFNISDIVDGNMFYLGDGTSGYLIETNPYFTDLQTFKGSGYYLSLLGLHGGDLILGDGFVDLETVRNQILDKIGKELLDGFSSKEEQLEALMEAGLSAKEALGLILGQTPNEDQLSQLTQPIIWWVRQEINGQFVLVPQVFFPSDYKANTNSTNNGSTIMGGGSVSIDVGGDFSNAGSIGSDGYIGIDVGGDANNSGTIVGEGGVSIDVGGSFANSGTISDANNAEYHKEQMESIANNIEKDIEQIEKLQKEYEEQAKLYEAKSEAYKKTNDLYTSKSDKYNSLLAKYNGILGTLGGGKYAGKVWSSDVKASNNSALASRELEELEKQMEALSKEMLPLVEILKVDGEGLNTQGEALNKQGEALNGLSESIKNQVESLENYVDNIKGVEINVGGDFVQNGVIEANKLIANVEGKLSSIDGITTTSFKTVLNANEIELVGAKLSSSQLELNAKDIA